MILNATIILEKITWRTSLRSSKWKPSEYMMRICFKIVDFPDSPAPIKRYVRQDSLIAQVRKYQPRSKIFTCLACNFLSLRINLSISRFLFFSSLVDRVRPFPPPFGKQMLKTIGTETRLNRKNFFEPYEVLLRKVSARTLIKMRINFWRDHGSCASLLPDTKHTDKGFQAIDDEDYVIKLPWNSLSLYAIYETIISQGFLTF